MARTVSFSPYQGDTIKALQQRQADLAKVQPLIPVRSIVNPVQGIASVADTLAKEINMARAHRDERAATAGMAQLMGSFGDQGPTSDQIGALAAYDPELAVKLYEKRQDTLAEQARLKAQQEFQTGERVAGEQFQAGQTQAGYTHEGQVNARELEEQKAAEARAAAQREREAQAQEGRLQARPQTEVAQLTADLKAGRIDQATYDKEFAKLTAPPSSAVTVNTGDSGDLRKAFNKQIGEKVWPQYMQEAATAASLKSGMELLDAINPQSQGPLVGRLSEMFPGVDNQAAAFQSIVKRLAPQQRPVGSGSTSDIEYQGMLDSLPSLINHPEANRLISGMVKAQAQIAIERGKIVTRWQSGELDDAGAFQALNEINSRSIMSPQLKTLIDAVNPNKAGAGAPSGGWSAIEEVPQ